VGRLADEALDGPAVPVAVGGATVPEQPTSSSPTSATATAGGRMGAESRSP
jgi:hypothetical protein